MTHNELPTGQCRAALPQSTRNLALWTGAWLLTTALMTFGAKLLWPGNDFLSFSAIALNLAAGAAMVFANIRHLRVQDELERKLFLDAAAITLGVGLVAGIAWQFYGNLPSSPVEPQISDLILLMGVTFLVSLVTAMRRLR
jgi:hypothetical protein